MELPATIAARAESRVEVKKSVFLGVVAPAATVAEADAVIAAIRKEHYSARHHCTALIMGDAAEIQRSNDDGEPSGTAGAPMLAVLRHHTLTNVVAVVTRYFGGTLLGAGGLVRAYTDAVSQALANASIVHAVSATRFALGCGYDVLGDFEKTLRGWLGGHHALLEATAYDPEPSFTIAVDDEELEALNAFLGPWLGRVTIAELGAGRISRTTSSNAEP
ncbi:MAG: IMPACT family protein [Propionibacteriaceae bacterium]|nr:IMPACT family protein [Propionibacteriaceae bacterium]